MDVYRPDRSPAPPARPTSSAAHARSSFSEGVTPLVPAAASINAAAAGSSRDPTPRNGADAAAVFGGAAGQQQQQLAGGAQQDVKAAFMKWLQVEMPQALSSVQSSAACSPRPDAAGAAGPGGLFAMQGEVLQGLTSSECQVLFKHLWLKSVQWLCCMCNTGASHAHPCAPWMLCSLRSAVSCVNACHQPCLSVPPPMSLCSAVADLGSTTTEDTEEAEWLQQQRQAQQLHEFLSARAAQGELLRGSLASSLRTSTSSLWAAPHSAAGSKPQLAQRQAGSGSSRPTSAPGRMRAGSGSSSRNPGASLIGDRCSPRSKAGCTTQGPTSRSSSRPGSPAARIAGSPTCPRTPSPGRCSSPACDSARPSSRPSSAAGSSRRRAAGSPSVSGQHAAAAAGGSRPQSPWAPAVVEYRQQPLGIDKPWQAANQLLVAAADEEVVQELAGALCGM